MNNMLTLDTGRLKRALASSNNVAEARAIIPVLSHVKIDCQPDGARLTVTDLEMSRQEFIASPNKIEPWAAVIPLKALIALMPKNAKAVKSAPFVDLAPADDGKITVCAAGGVSTLRCLPEEEFPTTPLPEACPGICGPAVILGEAWARLHARVFPAISTEETRFQLSGAWFELNGDAKAIATDGHRLHLDIVDVRVSGADQELLIRRAVLAAIAKDYAFKPMRAKRQIGVIKSGKNEGKPKYQTVTYRNDVSVYSSEIHVWIETASVRYVSRTLEGKFPDYKLLFKSDAPCTITATAGDVLATLDAVSHCCGDRARAIRIELEADLKTVGDGGIEITGQNRFPVFSVKNPDLGEAESTLNGSTRMTGRMREDKPRKRAKVKGSDAYDINAQASHAFEKDMSAWLARDPSEDCQEFGINPDYLSDICKAYDPDEEITISLWNENSALQVSSEADPGFISVIMPIRI